MFKPSFFAAVALTLVALAPAAYASEDLAGMVIPEVALGPDGHHWHYVEVSPRIMMAVDVHRAEDVGGTIRRTTLVGLNPKPLEVGGFKQDYMVMVSEMDCSETGRMRGVAMAGYIYKGLSWKQAGIEVASTPWRAESYGPLLGAWELTCGTVPDATALPDGISFKDMLRVYREAISDTQ